LFIELSADSPLGEIERRLRTAFGVANFSITWKTAADLVAVRSALTTLLPGRNFRSFKIAARRGTKDFSINSQEVNVEIGAFVQQLSGAQVRMEAPDLTCFIEFVGDDAYLYFEKIPGGGGLPARTSGKVFCLLSGGIDSPVAAYRLMRRGCRAYYVHFHSFPHTTIESQEKVRRLVRVLSRYQVEAMLYMVPFAELQREIVAYAPPPLRVLLYRRFMMRIADRLALEERAHALVTGDSLGQVASQTLQNLRAVSTAATLPIFRPLIGDDKEDIIRIARAIGTYEISILPDQDCCTMFVPKHPETMASIAQLDQAESALDVPRLVDSAVSAVSREAILADFDSIGEIAAVPGHSILAEQK
jgi:thiamine biosynthesis protein ThiI